MRIKRGDGNRTGPGIVYAILVELDGKSLVKIGVTHRRIQDRVSEILTGIFMKYRFYPYCKPLRFKTTEDPYQVEKDFHDYFSEFSYTPDKKFDGSTEFFDVPFEEVVKVYDENVVIVKKERKSRGAGTRAKRKPRKVAAKEGVFFTASKDAK
jgi:hypothetical protein